MSLDRTAFVRILQSMIDSEKININLYAMDYLELNDLISDFGIDYWTVYDEATCTVMIAERLHLLRAVQK